MTDTDIDTEKKTSVGNGIPVTHEYLNKRRKTRPRLSDALMQDLESYSQKIVEVAERQEGNKLNRMKNKPDNHPQMTQKTPTYSEYTHLFARSPEIIRGTKAHEIIESTVIPEIPGAKLNAKLLQDRVPVSLMQSPPLAEL